MKRFLAIIMTFGLALTSTSIINAQAQENITVTINNEDMKLDVKPVLENNRVLLPMRAIFEALDCNVAYRNQEGKQFVTATHGENQLVLEIGSNTMYVNGEEKTLDTPAKIYEGRTLVPVRAVSESLGANVKWDNKTKNVSVTSKQGQHKISSVTAEETVKADDGTVLIYVNYVYPVIDNAENNSFIDKINSEYKSYVNSFIKEAEENKDDAKTMLEEMGKENYRPMEFNLSYDVHTDKNDIMSITNYEFVDLGGAHPSSSRASRTFDLKNAKELGLADIVNGDEDQRHTMIYDVFVNYFEENNADFSSEAASELDKECDNVKFYLTDNSIVLYFDVYQVGSYAMGYPTVELQYSKGVFKLNLENGGYNTDSLE